MQFQESGLLRTINSFDGDDGKPLRMLTLDWLGGTDNFMVSPELFAKGEAIGEGASVQFAGNVVKTKAGYKIALTNLRPAERNGAPPAGTKS